MDMSQPSDQDMVLLWGVLNTIFGSFLLNSW
jgi:hypothetical protein